MSQQPALYPFPAVSGGAEVVKIAPDGSPETLWTSRDDLVYALGLAPAGKLLLGTGDKGTIIELEGDQIYSSVAKTASAEVTSFVSGPGGRILRPPPTPERFSRLAPATNPTEALNPTPLTPRSFPAGDALRGGAKTA
jgi:hypothetical protein